MLNSVRAILFVLGASAVSLTACSSPSTSVPASTAAQSAATPAVPEHVPDPPMNCSSCDEWNKPRAPFKVFGNTYYVGTLGLASVLIATDAGHVLIDVALPQSAAPIKGNIEALGFKAADIKYIATSHAHYDHVGGVHSMQQFTRASVLTSASTAQALGLGHPVPEDPQFGTGPTDVFPKVTGNIRVLKDGERVTTGGTTITAHATPGHTPGATTWTWQSCEGGRCMNVVYADSLTTVSNDGYRFTDVPGSIDTFRATFAKVAALPCDVVLSTHPAMTGMDAKLEARATSGIAPGGAGDPFIDADGCKALAAQSSKMLDERLRSEQSVR